MRSCGRTKKFIIDSTLLLLCIVNSWKLFYLIIVFDWICDILEKKNIKIFFVFSTTVFLFRNNYMFEDLLKREIRSEKSSYLLAIPATVGSVVWGKALCRYTLHHCVVYSIVTKVVHEYLQIHSKHRFCTMHIVMYKWNWSVDRTESDSKHSIRKKSRSSRNTTMTTE